jgi:hypothetical protein
MSELQKQEQTARQVLEIVIKLLKIAPSHGFKAEVLDLWYREYGRMNIAEKVRHESH